jgi:TPR repeat protein
VGDADPFVANIWTEPEDAQMRSASDALERHDPVTAFRIYTALANAGNANAAGELGMLYIGGRGTQRDYRKALELIRECAKNGVPFCEYDFGEFLSNNLITERDPEGSFNWLLKAANSHYYTAYIALANCYHYGTGVAANEVEADKWFARALAVADRYERMGKHDDDRHIASIYDQAGDWFMRRNQSQEGLAYYQRAIKLGQDHLALESLGQYYWYGNFVQREPTKAVELWKAAAEQGDDPPSLT